MHISCLKILLPTSYFNFVTTSIFRIDSHKHLLLRVVHQTLEAGEDTFTKLVAALRNVEETSEQVNLCNVRAVYTCV